MRTAVSEAPFGGRGTGASSTPSHSSLSSPKKPRALLISSMISIALIILLMVALRPRAESDVGPGSPVSIGSSAPEFSIPSLAGGAPIDLDQLGRDRGHSVVLNFFASWCVPCQLETPLLARTAKMELTKDPSIEFLGVDVADAPNAALSFIKRSAITYPVGSDRELRVAATLYGLNGEPDTFFIDPSGHVIGHVIGAITNIQLHEWLDRLVKHSE